MASLDSQQRLLDDGEFCIRVEPSENGEHAGAVLIRRGLAGSEQAGEQEVSWWALRTGAER